MRFSKTAKKLSDALIVFGAWGALSFAVLLAGISGAQAREIVDVTGVKVTVMDDPRRIVTLAPSLGELAADLLEQDLGRIVGVSEYTDYPPALEKVPSVGSYARFSLEKVLSLKPDLVLATQDGNAKDQVLHLRELGLPVVVVSTSTLKEVQESIQLVARAMNAEKRGEQLVTQLRKGIENIQARASKRPKRRVLLQIGEDPLIVVGKQSFLHEALETVGGVNVYGDAGAHYPRPSSEDAVRRNPDAVLVLALGKDLKPFYLMAKRWEQFPQMRAVQNKQIRVLQGDPILRPSLRLLEGLSLLERAVYGEK